MDTVFFVASKIVQFCIEPLNWLIIFLLLSLLFLALRKLHLCKRFLLFALLDLLVVGWLPSSEYGLKLLEDAIPKSNLATISVDDIGGIIILGGAIGSGEISIDRGDISINSRAERLTKGFELIRTYPNLPFVFSGYSGRLSPKGMSESEAFQQLIIQQGLPETMAHYENQSRNTYENVIYLKPIIQEFGAKTEGGVLKPWLLITSASHMLRSYEIFQKQDIAVIPVPVDYQTGNRLNWGKFDLRGGVQNWSTLNHELIGLLGYWLTGKI
jgi:uncharacterized SAM-binding protein YcdF (DUF218 family)